MTARFIPFELVQQRFADKAVAIVGSAPSCLLNEPGRIDAHEVVVRVNNYKLGAQQGQRADVHYSFYGSSITKTAAELQRDGVTLCMCKCPDSKPIESDWHEQRSRQNGIDFKYIYRNRASFWFCDTWVPIEEVFLEKMTLLSGHIPTTGFAAILDVLACKPKSIYLTGFDFFSSGMHNVNERWRAGDSTDPIRHVPEKELALLWSIMGMTLTEIRVDRKLRHMLPIRSKEAV